MDPRSGGRRVGGRRVGARRVGATQNKWGPERSSGRRFQGTEQDQTETVKPTPTTQHTHTNTHEHTVWPKSVSKVGFGQSLAKVGHTTKTLTLVKVGLAKVGHDRSITSASIVYHFGSPPGRKLVAAFLARRLLSFLCPWLPLNCAFLVW